MFDGWKLVCSENKIHGCEFQLFIGGALYWLLFLFSEVIDVPIPDIRLTNECRQESFF